MNYRIIDKDSYYRSGVFRHFSEDCRCSVSMTARIDVTDLSACSARRGRKFYIDFLYILSKVLNSRDDYKMGYLWQTEELICYDRINPTQYVFHEDTETCTPVYSVYTEDYEEDDGSGYTDRSSVSGTDLDLLASIIYCEAGGESYEGQVAVGAVVLNRMESGLYPDDMTDVIYQDWQFTPAMTGWLDQVRASGAPDYCYEAAQAALDGENPVGDCLYFHAGGGDGLTIGNQTFY